MRNICKMILMTIPFFLITACFTTAPRKAENNFNAENIGTIGGVFLAYIKMGYCAFSSANGMKLVCKSCSYFGNFEETIKMSKYDQPDGYKSFIIKTSRKKDTRTFAKESFIQLFEDIPSRL